MNVIPTRETRTKGCVLGVVSEMFESLEEEWEMVLEMQIRATWWRTEDSEGSFQQQQRARESKQCVSVCARAQRKFPPCYHSHRLALSLRSQVHKQATLPGNQDLEDLLGLPFTATHPILHICPYHPCPDLLLVSFSEAPPTRVGGAWKGQSIASPHHTQEATAVPLFFVLSLLS